jgi:protein gp37
MEGNTMSKIEWTDVTWNCVTGCTKISLSCKNCYAEKMTRRLAAMGQAKYANGFKVTTHVDIIEQPLEWKTPRRIFVNSMSDTFHNDVPEDFIFSLFDTMNRADWHQFQVLTKRSERFLKMNPYLDWSENIWMGVTIVFSVLIICVLLPHISNSFHLSHFSDQYLILILMALIG